LKLWAAPLILVAAAAGRSWRRVVIAAAAFGAAVLVVWLALSGTDGPIQVLTFRHAKGWEIETIPGLVMVARHVGHVAVEQVALCMPLTGLEMHDFGGVINADPYYVTLVAARNALLVAAVVLSFVEIYRARRATPVPA